jgi:hypothetical protein
MYEDTRVRCTYSLHTGKGAWGKISLQGSHADILSKGRDTKAIETDSVFSTRSDTYIFLLGEGYLETDNLRKGQINIFSTRRGLPQVETHIYCKVR